MSAGARGPAPISASSLGLYVHALPLPVAVKVTASQAVLCSVE